MLNKVIAAEVAQDELNRFFNCMDIDNDIEAMDADDKANFLKLSRKLTRAIESGALIINDSGEAEYTPQNPKSKHKDAIVFHERTGASLMAVDGKKDGHNVAKTYAMMADVTRLHPSVFAGLVGIDIKVCEAIFSFLMD